MRDKRIQKVTFDFSITFHTFNVGLLSREETSWKYVYRFEWFFHGCRSTSKVERHHDSYKGFTIAFLY